MFLHTVRSPNQPGHVIITVCICCDLIFITCNSNNKDNMSIIITLPGKQASSFRLPHPGFRSFHSRRPGLSITLAPSGTHQLTTPILPISYIACSVRRSIYSSSRRAALFTFAPSTPRFPFILIIPCVRQSAPILSSRCSPICRCRFVVVGGWPTDRLLPLRRRQTSINRRQVRYGRLPFIYRRTTCCLGLCFHGNDDVMARATQSLIARLACSTS